MTERHLLTSESVTEGHPDKMCDQVSDAILDAILDQDINGRVACETLVTTGMVLVAGEISTNCYIDIPRLVRETIKDIGYTDAKSGFDYETCAVITSIQEQSCDIAMGVDTGGAGDQGMMFGYACNETPELMPMPISLAHKLCKRLSEVRKKGAMDYLRPDGKSQVTVEYVNGVPKRVDTIVVSTQHDANVSEDKVKRDIIKHVINRVVDSKMMDDRTKIMVNPTGRFVIGGPQGDTGLTGRKIIVDTYGGIGRHGGGCFSGKDPTKVDRSAAYAARYIAKNIVAAGLAARCEIQLAYAIGVAEPVSIMVETYGTGKVEDAKLTKLIRQYFDLTPHGIINMLKLRQPIYRKTAAYGHFGREDEGFPWEKTDLSDKLKSAAKK
ncbi:MAG: methionine adenosyltransferase [Candidatus Edwardsbacteria bacterium RIFOXYD12_FULL_50_11]|jgi:S-adenosylmethionine synthetase|uniref:S-adenosylmethionine synthase n=1 Tax=Candidatus Edwardsbacteria bacterium GWF2_54_11 TaxID=1817851 RepID=A0A1F5RAP6_9BACT|nr:MAG: methionine adenosyltransferase [Candidatus Edwardsbacteria bacterium RifOxyC12_full_54_24]OGF08183.1 MAG: methionine adenosyltransferase [Candidatus Edwardsbacteria bacterium RifOxyA12_full_54_48]OGF11163.1 MAG: methionine adenosyltransferase [Candidatus Edwardsbacteria bacterium GWF2_54_11]OGF11480.1 MAG: methionine adenosyltransferase [Candidatus Edwardsbacteria bacterium GWE2_54_12]OGF14782.1 MAG: methionine adenosyltransferase [Candidatus Edwardsbacteria bacterium RIFOXYD12_FULL_50_